MSPTNHLLGNLNYIKSTYASVDLHIFILSREPKITLMLRFPEAAHGCHMMPHDARTWQVSLASGGLVVQMCSSSCPSSCIVFWIRRVHGSHVFLCHVFLFLCWWVEWPEKIMEDRPPPRYFQHFCLRVEVFIGDPQDKSSALLTLYKCALLGNSNSGSWLWNCVHVSRCGALLPPAASQLSQLVEQLATPLLMWQQNQPNLLMRGCFFWFLHIICSAIPGSKLLYCRQNGHLFLISFHILDEWGPGLD